MTLGNHNHTAAPCLHFLENKKNSKIEIIKYRYYYQHCVHNWQIQFLFQYFKLRYYINQNCKFQQYYVQYFIIKCCRHKGLKLRSCEQCSVRTTQIIFSSCLQSWVKSCSGGFHSHLDLSVLGGSQQGWEVTRF